MTSKELQKAFIERNNLEISIRKLLKLKSNVYLQNLLNRLKSDEDNGNNKI